MKMREKTTTPIIIGTGIALHVLGFAMTLGFDPGVGVPLHALGAAFIAAPWAAWGGNSVTARLAR